MRFVRYILPLVCAILLTAVPASARISDIANGEVLYHQDFADVSDIALTDIRKGTSSTDGSSLSLENGIFSIDTYDDGRVYAILPPSEKTKSFTVEVAFSFDEAASDNGYLGVILTSSGDEPGNISEVIFRAKGSVDDFTAPSKALAEQIAKGHTVTAKIPVENGVVEKLTLSSGDITEELQRSSLLVIGAGNKGFSARNAGVNIHEIYIVNGTGYTAKKGEWVDASYATEQSKAPATGDTAAVTALVSAVCALTAIKRMEQAKK